jgi:hypothetical protein
MQRQPDIRQHLECGVLRRCVGGEERDDHLAHDRASGVERLRVFFRSRPGRRDVGKMQ